MAWYENPTIAAILGALAGATLSVVASVYIWRRTQKTRRIDCIINDVSSLLSVSEKIRDQLQVTFSENIVETVYLISLDILNTGNMAVENQPINIRLEEGSHIVDYSLKTQPPVGFGKIEEEKNDANCLDLRVDLLNPGDQISLEIVSIDNPSDAVSVYLKNTNVQSRVIHGRAGGIDAVDLLSDRNLMVLAVFSALPLVGGFARALINVSLAQRVDKIRLPK